MLVDGGHGKTCRGGDDAHKGHNSSDFNGREDEFRFAVSFDAKEVDDENRRKENNNKDGFGDTLIPVSDGKGASDDLKWQSKEPLKTVASSVSTPLVAMI
jgi:hypothetical protein